MFKTLADVGILLALVFLVVVCVHYDISLWWLIGGLILGWAAADDGR